MIAPASHPARSDYDTELMLRVQQDDLDAFGELFQRHQQSIIRVVSHRMGTCAHSEDLAQEVFLRVFQSRHHYKPTAKFTTWLYVITRNVVINAQRYLSRRQAMLNRTYHLQRSKIDRIRESTRLNPVECAVGGETRQAVQNAIFKLGTRQQQAVLLVYQRGYTYLAAANSMGVSVQSMKQLLHRAKVNLRRQFETGGSDIAFQHRCKSPERKRFAAQNPD